MNNKSEVLVAVMNNPSDFAIARDCNWYRIPVSSADNMLKKRWPPKWLAFYQTKIFGEEAYSVSWHAPVLDIRRTDRKRLFPEEPVNPKSAKHYYQLFFGPLRPLPKPILSRRLRRLVFIQTTWEKFENAVEINDLFDESPLEDRLWAEFKRLGINAERQEFVRVNDRNYFLDFAIYCVSGKINVETDGDSWHTGPEMAASDNRRDNGLETNGWRVLRFNTGQIREEMADYCLNTIAENINRLGGIREGQFTAKRIGSQSGKQLGLFNGL